MSVLVLESAVLWVCWTWQFAKGESFQLWWYWEQSHYYKWADTEFEILDISKGHIVERLWFKVSKASYLDVNTRLIEIPDSSS